MTEAQDFAAALARAAESQREIKSSEKNMSYSLRNTLIKAVKDKKLAKMTERTTDIVVAVAASI